MTSKLETDIAVLFLISDSRSFINNSILNASSPLFNAAIATLDSGSIKLKLALNR